MKIKTAVAPSGGLLAVIGCDRPELFADRPVYDHNGMCIGCGVVGALVHPGNLPGSSLSGDEPCDPLCPFETGEFDAATVLRGATRGLVRYRRTIGHDIRLAIADAARELSDAPAELISAAGAELAAFLSEQTAPECALTGDELVHQLGMFCPVELIALAFYGAAAKLAGLEFDPGEFGDFRC